MKIDKKYPLLARPISNDSGIYQRIIKEEAGWEFLNFEARILQKGEVWKNNTEGNELFNREDIADLVNAFGV